MEFFESHSHYNDVKFENDIKKIIRENYEKGITSVVCAGYSLNSSEQAIQLSKQYDYMYATCGISPNDIHEHVDEDICQLEELAKTEKVVAIGEIGLDYYWNKENKEKQKEVFIKQIKIANRLNLPIVIHTREAIYDTLEIIKKNTVNKKGIFHCCPLNIELVKEALKLGFYISFSGNITFKNAKPDEILKLMPLDKILIETDCPYLTPEPNRGKRNDSSNLIYIAKKIADVKNMELEEIAKITYQNAKKIFNL